MADKLVNCMWPNPASVCRIFCFPWSGGGSIFHAKWGTRISKKEVEVCSLRYPARENRLREPGYPSQAALVEDVTKTLLTQFKEKPFIFFGHSLGAVMSFEVARNLKEVYGIEPEHLIVSGAHAPHSARWKNRPSPLCSEMSDDDLISYLGKLGGTPQVILQDRDMMKLFLPALRADYSICDKYEYSLPKDGCPLTCPVSVVFGSEEAKDIDSWSEVTTGPFRKLTLPGGHFYFIGNKENEDKLLNFVMDTIS